MDDLFKRACECLKVSENASIEDVNPYSFGARAFFFLIILVWGIQFIFAPIQGDYIGRSFMHLINLPFHEAGHIIFSFLGIF